MYHVTTLVTVIIITVSIIEMNALKPAVFYIIVGNIGPGSMQYV